MSVNIVRKIISNLESFQSVFTIARQRSQIENVGIVEELVVKPNVEDHPKQASLVEQIKGKQQEVGTNH